MEIVVLGSDGMLGHMLVSQFPGCRAVGRKQWEYKGNVDGLLRFIGNGDIVINCIGYVNKYANADPIGAVTINSMLPIQLSELCNKIGAKLIHISTDCVYDGRDGGYTVNSKMSPTDIYGASKMIGDSIDLSHHLLIRTSIIGPELKNNGIGLLDWLIKSKGKTINGWANHHWSGHTTLRLAQKINKCLGSVGYHIFAGTSIDKYTLATMINNIFKLDLTIVRTTNQPSCDRTMIQLDNIEELTRELELEQLYSYMIDNKHKYPHYNL